MEFDLRELTAEVLYRFTPFLLFLLPTRAAERRAKFFWRLNDEFAKRGIGDHSKDVRPEKIVL